ncbi:30S ribosomal protein S6e [Candidatus Woesearchaeota archaeon]|nr:30S ribosomal protein S6e [Candidatus Woesearchaeota archaeon]
MAEFKVVISDPKTGLSVQREVKDPAAKAFLGLKIGDSIKGETIDLQGYEFEITGGSDFCGFPMRKDVLGVGRKKILAYSGIGVRKQEKGMLQRKTVCGNTIHAKIAQVNLKAVKVGPTDIFSTVKSKADATKADRAAKKSEGEGGAKKAAASATKEEAPVVATA